MVLWALQGCSAPCGSEPLRCLDIYTLSDCSVPETVHCPQVCIDQGDNTTAGCDSSRPSNPCGCSDQPVTCQPDRRACFDTSHLMACRDADAHQTTGPFWEVVDCDAICISKGAVGGLCAATGRDEITHDCFCAASFL